MKKIQELDKESLSGKRVLLRCDLNVPISDEGLVLEHDADRIRKSLPTIEFLKDAGAKVVIIAHIGRDPKESLKPVADYMQIPLCPLINFDRAILDEHSVVLLENLRSNPGEESNDESFAQSLASYADLYVNDGFSVSHRAHASVVGIPKFLPSYAGMQLVKEVESLNRVLNPERPSVLIMGGAKFETKLPVIEKLLPVMDHVFIGGALVNNFLKERGYEVGVSLLDDDAHLGDFANHPKIILPDQVVVQNDAMHDTTSPGKSITETIPSDRIVDVVIPDELKQALLDAQTIIWNGPMGNYENGFTEGTLELTKLIANTGAFSVIGGGDSVALIESLKLESKFGFLSTGGGAMLEYLVQGTLPGIAALE